MATTAKKKAVEKKATKAPDQSPVQFINAFPTLIGVRQWEGVEELNKQLALEIYKERTRDPEGIYRSNIAGTWHSKDKVTARLGDAGAELNRMFFEVFSAITGGHAPHKGTVKLALQPWAMMYRDRGYATVHTHPNCHFSGVYYVETGPESPSKTMATGVIVKPGSLEFIDTRGGVGAQQVPGLVLQPSVRIPPVAGMMIVFPCWLPHFVHPVEGEGDRIAVACNATVAKYEKEET
jgi:uncharacterized protein (TIGR02466 family)